MSNWLNHILTQNNDPRFFRAPRVPMGDRRLDIYRDRYNRLSDRTDGNIHRARLINGFMIWMG